MITTPPGSVHLFRPPYRLLEPLLDVGRLAPATGTSGAALVWTMPERRSEAQFQAIRYRPPGVSLLTILPPAARVADKDDVLRMIEFCRPTAVLPYHEEAYTDDLRVLLSAPPEDLPASVIDFLRWRGLALDLDLRRLLRRVVELSGEIRSVNALARGVYLSRRALGRRFTNNGLPVPSHWLHISRLLRATLRIQGSDEPVAHIARSLGYPDAFALSNQMKRLVGVRPSEVRGRLGWEWVIETWLRKEAREGGFSDDLANTLLPTSAVAQGRADQPLDPVGKVPVVRSDGAKSKQKG
ncbi:helix-turn-helix domain-containing protein [Gaopeijia maritima]|uniref:AraC family transcriptional regulator n=2 Tax=Gaopeijia maritima TaxID=3119007 RepID=A0ABU9E7Z8_9BACT